MPMVVIVRAVIVRAVIVLAVIVRAVIVRAVIVLAIQTACRGGFCGAGLFGTDDENTRARKAGQQFFSQEFENKPVGRGISPPVGTISSGH